MSLSRSTLMNSLYESKTHPESILASTSELGLPCFLMASKSSKVISPKAKKTNSHKMEPQWPPLGTKKASQVDLRTIFKAWLVLQGPMNKIQIKFMILRDNSLVKVTQLHLLICFP